MEVKLWGTRGSIPSPGPETIRYGGNTSCVGVTLSDGSLLALDAGTGIRNLGIALGDEPARLHILLTHLHLDHIQGLVFFAPAFRPQTEIVIWGPASPEASLRDRIARYISAPLSPVEVRELPCDVSFRHCPETEWEIGPARIRAASVTHRGPTLGYRIDDGDSSLAYIPDHEPALGADLERARRGLDLRLRARPRRLAADPRRPVLRRRVPRAPRLGPLLPLPRPRLRQADRRRAHRALPPRPAALRRAPRPARRGSAASAGRRSAAARARSSSASRAPSTSCRSARRRPEHRRDRLRRLRGRYPGADADRAASHRRGAPSARRWSAGRARDGARRARRPDPQRERRPPLHRPPGRGRRAAGRARLRRRGARRRPAPRRRRGQRARGRRHPRRAAASRSPRSSRR